MEDKKHTPLPYKIVEAYADNGEFGLYEIIEVETGKLICQALRLKDAEFIVRACNSHYELLAFAEQVLTDIALGKLFMKRPEQLVTGILYSHERTMDLHEKAKAAISKAEGKQQ